MRKAPNEHIRSGLARKPDLTADMLNLSQQAKRQRHLRQFDECGYE
jgi:hypothetical protein